MPRKWPKKVFDPGRDRETRGASLRRAQPDPEQQPGILSTAWPLPCLHRKRGSKPMQNVWAGRGPPPGGSFSRISAIPLLNPLQSISYRTPYPMPKICKGKHRQSAFLGMFFCVGESVGEGNFRPKKEGLACGVTP